MHVIFVRRLGAVGEPLRRFLPGTNLFMKTIVGPHPQFESWHLSGHGGDNVQVGPVDTDWLP